MAAEICDIRYIGLTAPDFETERAFFRDPWGLEEVATEDGLSYLAAKGSSEAFILRLRKAEQAGVDLIALKAESRGAVDRLAARLGADDVRIAVPAAELTSPGGGYGFRFFDCDGRLVEVSADVAERTAADMAAGDAVPATLSHLVFHTPDIKRTVEFYGKVLGFLVSDWLGEFMVFMRCNPVHHRLAFVPGPAALNHVAFEMRGLEEMMIGMGRLLKREVPLFWGPGRHRAGNNTFSYWSSPAGHIVEYTAELERVDHDAWEAKVYPPGPDVGDQWGSSVLGGGIDKMPRPTPDPFLNQVSPV